MKSLFRAISSAPKRYGSLAIVLAAVIIPATLFAWGPSRTTYTVQEPAKKVAFNAITNNPNYGDERNFVTVKDPATGNFTDEITVEPGKEYEVRILVHNNADANLNLKALNTNVKAAISSKTGTRNAITGYVDADNADPKQVYDDVFFKSDKNFNLAYVDGTARVYNSGYAAGGQGKAVSTSLFTQQGFKLGYAAEGDGIIPGCFEYINYVYFKVKPQFEQKADFAVQKKVSQADKNVFKDTMAATAGETVDYRIEYKNTGDVQQNNVVVKDKMPAGVSYVPGTAKLFNAQNPNGKVLTDTVTTEGINIGSHGPNANSFVTFKAKIADTKDLTCGANTLTNTARVITDYGVKEDTADVTTEKKCEEVPAKIEVCELATKKLTQIDAKQFDATKHSKNLKDCETVTPETPVTPVTPEQPTPVAPVEETPVEETPVVELPQTGASDFMVAGTALAGIVAALSYVALSRRSL